MLITRYITREVANTFLGVIAVLMLALLSQQMVRYLNFAALGKIPTGVLMQLVSFEVPYLLALLMPLALYLGILLAYGRLYADNEMLIMQQSGFDARRLLYLTMGFALGVMVLVWIFMLWVNPMISTKRQAIMSSDEATAHLVETLIPGRFQKSADGTHVMYVEKLSVDRKKAENVFIVDVEKKADSVGPSRSTIVVADQGYQMKDPDSSDQFFVTQDGYRYEGIPGQNDFQITQFKRYAVRILQGDGSQLHKQDESLSSWQLLSDYHNPKRAAELQWRFSMGISALLLALLAVPFSQVKPRQGRYLILLPAILIYIIYFNLLVIARRWVDLGTVSVFLGLWWVHGLMLLMVAGFVFRRKQWKSG